MPVVKVAHSQAMPGGAGNVARNVVGLDARCSLLTVTGKDVAGDELRVLLQTLPSLTCNALIDQTRPTSVKTRFIASSQQVLRVDQEVDTPLSADVAQQLVDQATKLLPEVDVVILSDYAKGVLTEQVTSAVIAAARASQVPVIVDPKGKRLPQVRRRIAGNAKPEGAAGGYRCGPTYGRGRQRATKELSASRKLTQCLLPAQSEGCPTCGVIALQCTFQRRPVKYSTFRVLETPSSRPWRSRSGLGSIPCVQLI